MLPNGHEQVLATVLARLAGTTIPWSVSGSVALALHGVEVECGDLDILTTAAAAPRVGALLAGEELEPVRFRERGRVRGHIGRVRLGGVDVEVLGDVQNLLAGGGWSEPPRLGGEVELLELAGRPCPVVRLAALRAAYAAMQRPERVALIDAAR